jgi:hypothetical protein
LSFVSPVCQGKNNKTRIEGLKAAFGLLYPQDEDGTPTKPINSRQAASGE